MSIHLTKLSKLVKILADLLQSLPFLAIPTKFIKKLSGVISFRLHINKQLKGSELKSVQLKYIPTLTSLGKELETN